MRTGVFPLHPSPEAWGRIKTHQHRFFSCCYETGPQGGSISPQSFFFFFFSVEVDLVSDVFVFSEQELDSVIHRLSILLQGLFPHRLLQCVQ